MNQPINQQISSESAASPSTIYELVGGQETFFRLVTKFYDGVETDPVLRPMYPADLKESAWWTALFLIQYCGGPGDYSAQKGHPRLRMRHLPFKIGVKERDAWMHHMRIAVESEITHPGAKEYLLNYFERTATFMINSPD